MSGPIKLAIGGTAAAVVILAVLAGLLHDNEALIVALNVFGVVGAAAGAAIAAFLSYKSAETSSNTAKEARRAVLLHKPPTFTLTHDVLDHNLVSFGYAVGDTLAATVYAGDGDNVTLHWKARGGRTQSEPIRSFQQNVTLHGVKVTEIEAAEGLTKGSAYGSNAERIWLTCRWNGAEWAADYDMRSYQIDPQPRL